MKLIPVVCNLFPCADPNILTLGVIDKFSEALGSTSATNESTMETYTHHTGLFKALPFLNQIAIPWMSHMVKFESVYTFVGFIQIQVEIPITYENGKKTYSRLSFKYCVNSPA